MPLSRAELTGSVNPHLSQMVLSLGPETFKSVNDLVAPPLNRFGYRSGTFAHNTRLWMADTADEVSRKGSIEVDVERPTRVSFVATKRGFKCLITRDDLEDIAQGGGDPNAYVQDQVTRLAVMVKMRKERRLMTKITTAANFDSSMSGAAGALWTAAGGDPLSDFSTAKKALIGRGRPGTHFVADLVAQEELRKHISLVAFGSPQARAMVDDAQIESILGLKPIWSEQRYATAADVLTSVIGVGNVVVFHMPSVPGPTSETPACFCRTMVSRDLEVREWEDQSADGMWYECVHTYTHEFGIIDNTTDKDSEGGYLITTCLS